MSVVVVIIMGFCADDAPFSGPCTGQSFSCEPAMLLLSSASTSVAMRNRESPRGDLAPPPPPAVPAARELAISFWIAEKKLSLLFDRLFWAPAGRCGICVVEEVASEAKAVLPNFRKCRVMKIHT